MVYRGQKERGIGILQLGGELEAPVTNVTGACKNWLISRDFPAFWEAWKSWCPGEDSNLHALASAST